LKTWVKIVLVLAGLAALVAYFVVSGEQQRGRMTAQAAGTVTGVDFDVDDESSSLDETAIRFVFPAGGRQVNSETSRPGDRTADFAPGRKIVVCYNPQEPAEADIAEGAGARCGG
jgi:hypothetical protein